MTINLRKLNNFAFQQSYIIKQPYRLGNDDGNNNVDNIISSNLSCNIYFVITLFWVIHWALLAHLIYSNLTNTLIAII